MNGILYDARRKRTRKANLERMQNRYEEARLLNSPVYALSKYGQDGTPVTLRVTPAARYEVSHRGLTHTYSDPEKALNDYEVE